MGYVYITTQCLRINSSLYRFSEFLAYLADRDLRYDDEHWAPYYKACTPCHVDYNFVGHFETLYWDVHLLANKTGLTSKWDDKDVSHSTLRLNAIIHFFRIIFNRQHT